MDFSPRAWPGPVSLTCVPPCPVPSRLLGSFLSRQGGEFPGFSQKISKFFLRARPEGSEPGVAAGPIARES